MDYQTFYVTSTPDCYLPRNIYFSSIIISQETLILPALLYHTYTHIPRKYVQFPGVFYPNLPALIIPIKQF